MNEKKLRPLYEITGECLGLESLLEEIQNNEPFNDEAPTDELMMDAIREHLGDTEEELHQKVDGCMALVFNWEAMARVRESEAARLQVLADADKQRAEKLREAVLASLQMLGKEKMQTARFQLSVVGNGGLEPVSVSVSVDQLPEKYQVVKTEVRPDKTALREALKNGEQIEGVALGVRGKRLVVK